MKGRKETMILWMFYVALGYILGSVPFGHVVAKYLYGADIQSMGSGNIGATNVYRNLGWSAALLTAVGDVAKGVVPVILAKASGSGLQWVSLVGLAVVLGHCYPIFLHFRGGKGVSTTLAVLLVLKPLMCLIFVIVWLMVLLAQGRVSLASLAAAAASPVIVELLPKPEPGLLFFTWVSAVIIFLRHRENIERIMAGTEKQVFRPIRFF